MQPTMEILENVRRNSEKNKDEVFTRLYRYMLRKDIYYVAYHNLYANSGASTKGINEDTADGFGEDKIERIIQSLADESYTPSPARRVYLKKPNGKMRPLGIPTFTDKLVQEVLRMILEAVYEPVFVTNSHGFRPNRSCHTALRSLRKEFTGIRWFVEGDIRGCFDNINHHALVEIISRKIKDARLIKLIWKFLKAGYCEEWVYHNTYSGTPQGGIVSPLFANIYLHELDKFVLRMAEEFDRPRERNSTHEYNKIMWQIEKVKRELQTADNNNKAALIKRRNTLQAEQRRIPYTSQTDKKIKYIRYADDFIIGVKGDKEDCIRIKKQLSEFIANVLFMELSEEKTLITHSNQYARFLGYDVRVRRNGQIKRSGKNAVRTLNNKVELNIPLQDKIMAFLFKNDLVIQKPDGKIIPISRTRMLHCTELEIVQSYNAELRGICNYYALASNFNKLNYFAYLMEYSCLCTLAAKHKSSIRKILKKYNDGQGRWGIPYKTKVCEKRAYFAEYAKCRETKEVKDVMTNVAFKNRYSRTTFDKRLAAGKCELCGTADAKHYEIHHVRKVVDLKGKELWEQVMIAKRRKTMVVCEQCHCRIHGRNRVL
ncbi:MAG: reverse transcriptase domain-containing protein [Candidatus Faecivicinus sp.]